MAINQYFPMQAIVYMGLSTDTKPANVPPGSRFIETDTLTSGGPSVFLFLNTGVWTPVTGFGLLGN